MLCFLKLNIIIIGWLHVCSACSAGTGFELPDLSHWVRPIGLAPLDLFHWVCSIGFVPYGFYFSPIFFRGCPPIVGAAVVCGVQRRFVYLLYKSSLCAAFYLPNLAQFQRLLAQIIVIWHIKSSPRCKSTGLAPKNAPDLIRNKEE